MATATEKRIVVVPPFGVEIDCSRNEDIMLQSIINCRLRSAIGPPGPVTNSRGEEVIPEDSARAFSRFPRVPGMQVHVDPANCKYVIQDPLHGDEALCERIRRHLSRNSAFRVADRIDGVPPKKGELDRHRMKTLCRELIQLMEGGWAKLAKGPKPNLKDVDDLPGNYLLNPGLRTQTSQPRFEKDWDMWYEQLAAAGK